jgi:hypothetical protein
MKECETGFALSRMVAGKRNAYRILVWNSEDDLEDTGFDERVTFKRILKKQKWVICWVHLVQGRGKERALANTVM